MKILRDIGHHRSLVWLGIIALIVMALVISPIAAAGPLVPPIGPP
jgi:hypothetical protein